MPGNHRFDSSPVVYERPARSVPHFALITALVITFLLTGRDAAITVNTVKIDITQYCCLSQSYYCMQYDRLSQK